MFARFTYSALSRFKRDDRGNVAIIFGLAALPLLCFCGFAMDYSRGLSEQAKLQAAADSTALALVRDGKSMSAAQIEARGQQLFRAFLGGSAAPPTVTIASDSNGVQVRGTLPMPTSLMRVAGTASMEIGATSSATYSQRKIEVALVLDNTGSMGQLGKMPALKAAVNTFIDQLKAMPVPAGNIKMSVVPFNTQVKIGASYASAPWLDWNVTLENLSLGSRTQPPSPIGWGGCISDRGQPHDASSAGFAGGSTAYVASQCQFAPLAQMQTLTSDLESVRTTVNGMSPAGATNLAVGYTAGLATLRSDTPFGAGSASAGVQKFLVLLTDGNNTMNRWGGNGAEGNYFVPQIDARMQAACDAARLGATAGIRVFTIRVIEGNEALLKGCASSPADYYPAADASGIAPAFQSILNKISNVRLTS